MPTPLEHIKTFESITITDIINSNRILPDNEQYYFHGQNSISKSHIKKHFKIHAKT